MARYGVLPDAVLPAVQDRQENRHVFYRCPGLRRRNWPCLGRLPAHGRPWRSSGLPVDVPSLGARRRGPRCWAAVVAPRSASGPGRAACAIRLLKVATAGPRSTHWSRCSRPLPRSQASLPCEALDAPRPGSCPDRLAPLAAGAHVLWCGGRWHWNPALRIRHYRLHPANCKQHHGQLAICANLDCEPTPSAFGHQVAGSDHISRWT